MKAKISFDLWNIWGLFFKCLSYIPGNGRMTVNDDKMTELPSLRCTGMCMEELKKSTADIKNESWSPSQHSNAVPPKHEPAALTTQSDIPPPNILLGMLYLLARRKIKQRLNFIKL